ncbi:hypothetical protein BSQ33_01960 [Vibrio gazogenes]|uniref:Uncharacterized protein n=1 Tax=Vibrio gazogenes TaxID=687 RepID=A0A1Z2SBQ0_VIBGA|nr:hypothetical protein BSQ33_01960 [Vibrio gazogenes]
MVSSRHQRLLISIVLFFTPPFSTPPFSTPLFSTPPSLTLAYDDEYRFYRPCDSSSVFNAVKKGKMTIFIPLLYE